MHFLHEYSLVSEQQLGVDKSYFFTNSGSNFFNRQIQSILGFQSGEIPFTYLGVPTFKAAKAKFLRPIVAKIKRKLVSQKGKMLSMMGSVQLAIVIVASIAYSFQNVQMASFYS